MDQHGDSRAGAPPFDPTSGLRGQAARPYDPAPFEGLTEPCGPTMLNFIRSHAASWIVKILFFVLILSFAAWGIGDIFRLQTQGGPAITVGEVEIGREEVAKQFDTLIRSMQPLFNNRLDREQASVCDQLERGDESCDSVATICNEFAISPAASTESPPPAS